MEGYAAVREGVVTLTPKAKTTLVLAAGILVAIGWEALALATQETAAWTFSRLFWDVTSNPLAALVVGVLAGHLAFPKSRCLHCGSTPYRRTPDSEVAFDSRLALFAYSTPVAQGGLFFALLRQSDPSAIAAIEAGKRSSGFPSFREVV